MNTHKDDEIDLIALLKTVFIARGFVFKTTILFAILGLILAALSPTKYKASSTFMPQLSEGQTNSPFGGLDIKPKHEFVFQLLSKVLYL